MDDSTIYRDDSTPLPSNWEGHFANSTLMGLWIHGDKASSPNQELAPETDAAAPDQPVTMAKDHVEAWNGREFYKNPILANLLQIWKRTLSSYGFCHFYQGLHVIHWKFSGIQ